MTDEDTDNETEVHSEGSGEELVAIECDDSRVNVTVDDELEESVRETTAELESLNDAAPEPVAPSADPDTLVLVVTETEADLDTRELPPVAQAERLDEELDDFDILGDAERLAEAVDDSDAVPREDSESEAGVDLEMDGEADIVGDLVASPRVCVAT